MKATNRLIVSMLVVTGLAAGFWLLILGPKRQEASSLNKQVSELQSSLVDSQTKTTQALAARHQFPADYQQIVVLGKAVPPTDDTSSLMYELSQIAYHTKVSFNSFQLASTASTSSAPPAAPSASATSTPTSSATSTPKTSGSSTGVTTAAAVPATEAAASLLPLGATIGPANLAVMPYELAFKGNFFRVADFMRRIDSLVHTGRGHVDVDGRLVTLNGFALNAEPNEIFPELNATFSVTTYLTPANQSVTVGATPTGPSTATATPTAATTSSGATSTSTSTPTSETK